MKNMSVKKRYVNLLNKIFLILAIFIFIFASVKIKIFANENKKEDIPIQQIEDIEEKSLLATKFEELTLESIIVAIMGVVGSSTGIALVFYFLKKAIKKYSGIIKTVADANINIADLTKKIDEIGLNFIKQKEDVFIKIEEALMGISKSSIDMKQYKEEFIKNISRLEDDVEKIIDVLKTVYVNNSKLVANGVSEEIRGIINETKKV